MHAHFFLAVALCFGLTAYAYRTPPPRNLALLVLWLLAVGMLISTALSEL